MEKKEIKYWLRASCILDKQQKSFLRSFEKDSLEELESQLKRCSPNAIGIPYINMAIAIKKSKLLESK